MPPPSDDPLAALRVRYWRSLPEKRARLESLAQRLARAERCEDELRALSHQLAGSGASYGWLAISAAATAVGEVEDAELGAALRGLIDAIDAAYAEGSPA